jgi:hypothetical protein
MVTRDRRFLRKCLSVKRFARRKLPMTGLLPSSLDSSGSITTSQNSPLKTTISLFLTTTSHQAQIQKPQIAPETQGTTREKPKQWRLVAKATKEKALYLAPEQSTREGRVLSPFLKKKLWIATANNRVFKMQGNKS